MAPDSYPVDENSPTNEIDRAPSYFSPLGRYVPKKSIVDPKVSTAHKPCNYVSLFHEIIRHDAESLSSIIRLTVIPKEAAAGHFIGFPRRRPASLDAFDPNFVQYLREALLLQPTEEMTIAEAVMYRFSGPGLD